MSAAAYARRVYQPDSASHPARAGDLVWVVSEWDAPEGRVLVRFDDGTLVTVPSTDLRPAPRRAVVHAASA
jgi:hypothetical protein